MFACMPAFEFIAGWRMCLPPWFSLKSYPLCGIEATFMIMALFGAGHWGTVWYPTLVFSFMPLIYGVETAKPGPFFYEVIFLPFSLSLFCLTAGLAVLISS